MLQVIALLLTLVLLPVVHALPSETVAEVAAAFNASSIVPDALSSFNPTAVLGVEYTIPASAGGGTKDADLGTNFTMPQVLNRPAFFLVTNDSTLLNQTYVLFMLDLDALTPQNRSLSQIRHMMAGGMVPGPLVNGSSLLSNNTPAISNYLQPSPPNTSDPHRYVWLLYVQSTAFTTQTLITPNSSVTMFNVSAFAQMFGLGDPITGNFMTVSTMPSAVAAEEGSSASAESSTASALSPTATLGSTSIAVGSPALSASLSIGFLALTIAMAYLY